MNDKNYLIKLGGQAITVLMTIIISMTGYWMTVGRNLATSEEVNDSINTRMSLLEKQIDTEMRSLTIQIEREVKDNRLNQFQISKVIEKNTEAIQSLRVELATFTKAIEILEEQERRRNAQGKHSYQTIDNNGP